MICFTSALLCTKLISRIIYGRWCSCSCVCDVRHSCICIGIIGSQFIDIDAHCTAFCADRVMVCSTFHWINAVIFSTSFVPNAKKFQSSYVLPSFVFASFSLTQSNENCILFFLFCTDPIVRFQFHFDSSVILLSMNLSPSYATFCDCNMRQATRVKSFFPM